MAKIIAKGNTEEFGKIKIEIIGSEKVDKIICDDEDVKAFFAGHIKDADGEIANGFHPESDTMLQAYAFCLMVFDYKDIHIEGDIGEIEFEEGVVY